MCTHPFTRTSKKSVHQRSTPPQRYHSRCYAQLQPYVAAAPAQNKQKSEPNGGKTKDMCVQERVMLGDPRCRTKQPTTSSPPGTIMHPSKTPESEKKGRDHSAVAKPHRQPHPQQQQHTCPVDNKKKKAHAPSTIHDDRPDHPPREKKKATKIKFHKIFKTGANDESRPDAQHRHTRPSRDRHRHAVYYV